MTSYFMDFVMCSKCYVSYVLVMIKGAFPIQENQSAKVSMYLTLCILKIFPF